METVLKEKDSSEEKEITEEIPPNPLSIFVMETIVNKLFEELENMLP